MTEKSVKNLFFLQMLLLSGLLVFCPGCGENKKAADEKKFEIDKDFQRGPLIVHVRIDKAKITIAQTLLLELQAVMEPGYEVKMPTLGENLENFGILDWDNLGNKLDEKNNVVSTYQYRLEPFLSGTFSIPVFTFEFYDVNKPQENKHELATEPVEIEVASLLGEQRAELKIANIEGVVEMPAKASYLWLWIFCAVILAAAATTFFVRRKKTAEIIRIFKPAHEIAYDRLHDLVKRDLVKAGKIKEFYEEISDILRHYIEHRFNIKAPERTTEEFLVELPAASVLSKSQQDSLAEFLSHCDLVKFAKYAPTNEQIQKTFDLVKNFIEATKSEEKKIDVTQNYTEQPIEAGSV